MISTLPRRVKLVQQIKFSHTMSNSVSSMLKASTEQAADDDISSQLEALSIDVSKRPTKKTVRALPEEVWLSNVSQLNKCELSDILLRDQAVFFSWPLVPSRHSVSLKSNDRFAALDCEMIATAKSNNYPARLSLVDYYGLVLMDVYIRPNSRVTNYRTKWSGVNPRVLQRAEANNNLYTLRQALDMLESHIDEKKYILIGHGINNDFMALRWKVPANKFLDTQKLDFFQHEAGGCGLKRVLKHYFNIAIQTGSQGHDSVEDARASMVIFRTFEREFRVKYNIMPSSK